MYVCLSVCLSVCMYVKRIDNNKQKKQPIIKFYIVLPNQQIASF